ncbi:hypothetical protein Pan258_45820 [Symmachiella dynata]|uniref:hypothetical protein n=1 Tax=Symmachiella dynata TaxID=2527995 RepID=UPI001189FF9B|nr:hypothetical protein [Symmachiella dynata]QDT50503.1 hypothetical protein Pan258_45820 [Symmachiella dynata]
MSDLSDGIVVKLGVLDAIDKEDFVPPSERHLGDEADIEMEPFRFRIGDRPIARDLRRLYELAERDVPEDLEVFHDNNIWIITHAVSVLGTRSFKSVADFGYRMRYADSPRVTILEVMPQTRFITHIGGCFKNEAEIDIHGGASVPAELTDLLDQIEAVSVGGELRLSSKTNIVGRLSFSVVTPIITATGVGDSGSEWVFRKDENPLVGDHLMFQIVHTPRYQKTLKFKAQVYATVMTSWFFPARLESDWVELTCRLR